MERKRFMVEVFSWTGRIIQILPFATEREALEFVDSYNSTHGDSYAEYTGEMK